MSMTEHPLQMQREEHDHTLYAKRVVDIVGNALIDGPYDYISLSYTDSNLTGVVYRLGGATGDIVTTLTLGYDGDNNLISVEKS